MIRAQDRGCRCSLDSVQAPLLHPQAGLPECAGSAELARPSRSQCVAGKFTSLRQTSRVMLHTCECWLCQIACFTPHAARVVVPPKPHGGMQDKMVRIWQAEGSQLSTVVAAGLCVVAATTRAVVSKSILRRLVALAMMGLAASRVLSAAILASRPAAVLQRYTCLKSIGGRGVRADARARTVCAEPRGLASHWKKDRRRRLLSDSGGAGQSSERAQHFRASVGLIFIALRLGLLYTLWR